MDSSEHTVLNLSLAASSVKAYISSSIQVVSPNISSSTTRQPPVHESTRTFDTAKEQNRNRYHNHRQHQQNVQVRRTRRHPAQNFPKQSQAFCLHRDRKQIIGRCCREFDNGHDNENENEWLCAQISSFQESQESIHTTTQRNGSLVRR